MISFSRRKSVRDAAERAYQRVVEQARQPLFFTAFGVPDTVDGRFELICLHSFLYLHRLKSERPQSAAVSQAFFDAMFTDMDRGLREMGTGDLSVGRHVKRMAQGFYGRIRAYQDGLERRRHGARRRPGAQSLRHGARIGRKGSPRWPRTCGARAELLARQPAAELAAGNLCFPSPGLDRPGYARRARLLHRDERSRPPNFRGWCRSRGWVPSRFARRSRRRRRNASASPDGSSWYALDRLTAAVALHREGGGLIRLEAEFEAEFAQECVVTLEPVAGKIAQSFALVYGPAEDGPDEIDLDADAPAFEPLTGDAIDIGEAVAQELSLALPEFPRDPDAVLDPAAIEEAPDGSFAALAKLRRPLQQ